MASNSSHLCFEVSVLGQLRHLYGHGFPRKKCLPQVRMLDPCISPNSIQSSMCGTLTQLLHVDRRTTDAQKAIVRQRQRLQHHHVRDDAQVKRFNRARKSVAAVPVPLQPVGRGGLMGVEIEVVLRYYAVRMAVACQASPQSSDRLQLQVAVGECYIVKNNGFLVGVRSSWAPR